TTSFSFTVLWVNDEPPLVATNTGATLFEGDSVFITTAELQFTDLDSPADSLIYSLVGGAVNGQLELVSNPGVPVSGFTQADIDLGQLMYVHNGSETLSDSLVFQVNDGLFTSTPEAFTLSIFPVNDELPVMAINTGTVLAEGGSVLITNAELQFTDLDSPADSLTYSLVGGAVNGQLELVSNPGLPITTFTQATIDLADLAYVHNGSETPSDTLVFQVDDGLNISAPELFSILVIPVNDELPLVTTNTGATLFEGDSVLITSAALQFTDLDSPADSLAYSLVGGAVNGQLELVSNPGVPIIGFTQTNIDLGQLMYVHNGTETLSDTLVFQVNDGINSSVPEIFSLTVVPVNDNAPVIIPAGPFDVSENSAFGFPVGTPIQFSDLDDPALLDTYAYAIVEGAMPFVIDSTGQLSVSDTIDFEIQQQYTLTITVSDGTLISAGQPIQINVLDVDEIAPVVAITPLNTNNPLPTLSGTIDDPSAAIEVGVNSNLFPGTNNADGTWSSTITTSLPDGTYDVTVTATDLAGNQATDSTLNELYVDATAPIVTIDTMSTFDATPSLTGSVDDISAVVQVSVGGFTYTAVNNGNGTWFLDGAFISQALPAATYEVVVSATDALGNVGSDITANELTILTGPVLALPATNVKSLDFVAQWEPAGDVLAYVLEVAHDASFTKLVPGYESFSTIATSQLVSGLDYNLTYYYRVKVQYNSGVVSDYSNVVAVQTILDPGTTADSLALVSIYQSTDGLKWTNKTNWLRGRMKDWYGVTMTGTRVTSLDLRANHLSGSVSHTAGLDQLQTLFLQDNELTQVTGIELLTGLQTVDISLNHLDFLTISQLLTGGYTLTYKEQKQVLTPVRTLQQIGTTYPVARVVPGGETYTWYKNDTLISETLSSFTYNITDFVDEGVFHAQVGSSLVPDLVLTTHPVFVRVSSLQRDSTALRAIFDGLATDPAQLPGWTTTSVKNWTGVTVTNERVTALALSNKKLAGEMPPDILDIAGLVTVDLSNNAITTLPDLSSLTNLTQFNISGNALEFGSIEPNVAITGINYQNQARIGTYKTDTIPAGSDFFVEIVTSGSALNYQWKRNDTLIVNATDQFYHIQDIRYETMGDFTVDVTSSLVPNLTLTSKVQQVLGFGNIEFYPAFRFADGQVGIVEQGIGRLFKIIPGSPYDTIQTVNISNGKILMEKIVLGDYLLLAKAADGYVRTKEYQFSIDSIAMDSVQFIPTYFESVLEWDSANVLQLRDFIYDSLAMLRIPPPLRPDGGNGIISLTVESNFVETSTTGRIESRRRVKKAGCSLRRRTTGTGGRPMEDVWELIAYQETDDNGEVNFGFLPVGFYRLNIQYPGVPMDPASFIEFEIGTDKVNDGYELLATVEESGIFVEMIAELGTYRKYFRELNVYPNPANQTLQIHHGTLPMDNIRVMLMDLTGRVLHEQPIESGHTTSFSLDVSGLVNGIYLLHFYEKGNEKEHIVTYKVIVQH
ncbi:MAG: Ig-like domain-containing protein, partial [Cyclobacteriaceae bacterium]|nr:Ig-like domain-containing protein [Cyclobacteriaceae bacterium]